MSEALMSDLPINSEHDIVMARKLVRSMATELGFSPTDVTRIVTAASELTRNIYIYAGCGRMVGRTLNDGTILGIELAFEDKGPGIPNIEKAMQPGFTTSKGMGMGLPGSKRLMDEMVIRSAPGEGTSVTVRKWLRRR